MINEGRNSSDCNHNLLRHIGLLNRHRCRCGGLLLRHDVPPPAGGTTPRATPERGHLQIALAKTTDKILPSNEFSGTGVERPVTDGGVSPKVSFGSGEAEPGHMC